MPRFHLLEIEDQPWCPTIVRDGSTDYLRFVIEKSRPYAAIVPELRRAIERMESARIVDLCSGGAGPWPGLLDDLAREDGPSPTVTLTDLYPNLGAFERTRRIGGGRVDYRAAAVDAANVPDDLAGFRTLFSSFHHFRPERAVNVLRNAVARRQPIGVFEATQRSPIAVLAMLLTPLAVLLVTPFIRPFRWWRLAITYVIPIIPLVVVFDGIVSCLRTYTPDELLGLTAALDGSGYEWQTGQVPIQGSPIPVPYLIGLPPAQGFRQSRRPTR